MDGSAISAWMSAPTEPIHYNGPRLHSSTDEPTTFGRFNCCWDTPGSRVRFAISELSSVMRSILRNRQNPNGGRHHDPPPAAMSASGRKRTSACITTPSRQGIEPTASLPHWTRLACAATLSAAGQDRPGPAQHPGEPGRLLPDLQPPANGPSGANMKSSKLGTAGGMATLLLLTGCLCAPSRARPSVVRVASTGFRVLILRPCAGDGRQAANRKRRSPVAAGWEYGGWSTAGVLSSRTSPRIRTAASARW